MRPPMGEPRKANTGIPFPATIHRFFELWQWAEFFRPAATCSNTNGIVRLSPAVANFSRPVTRLAEPAERLQSHRPDYEAARRVNPHVRHNPS
jgi:hypothetical protein